jgi:hypothetical protein
VELTVPGGGSGSTELSVVAKSSELKPYRVYGGDRLIYAPNGAMTAAEMDAVVYVTEVDDAGAPVEDGDKVQVPVYFLPRPSTLISASPDPVWVDPDELEAEITLRDRGEGTGNAELFALLAGDEIEDNIDPRINIDFVGARVDESGGRAVEFAIHTSGMRVIPHEVQAQIILDTNGDDMMDYFVFNADEGLATRGVPNGRQRMIIRRVVGTNPLQLDNSATLIGFAEVDIHSRSLIMRVDAARLGFAAGSPIAFDGIVRLAPGMEDVRGDVNTMKAFDVVPDGGWSLNGVGSDRFSFDETALAFDLSEWTVPFAGPGEKQVTVTIDASAVPDVPDQILAVYPMNPPGPGDVQRLRIEAGESPPLVTPTPTTAPRPENWLYLPALLKQ